VARIAPKPPPDTGSIQCVGESTLIKDRMKRHSCHRAAEDAFFQVTTARAYNVMRVALTFVKARFAGRTPPLPPFNCVSNAIHSRHVNVNVNPIIFGEPLTVVTVTNGFTSARFTMPPPLPYPRNVLEMGRGKGRNLEEGEGNAMQSGQVTITEMF